MESTGPGDLDCVSNGAADIRIGIGWVNRPAGDISGLFGDISSRGSIDSDPEDHSLLSESCGAWQRRRRSENVSLEY